MRHAGVPWPDIMNALEDLYHEIDQRAYELFTLHSDRLLCRQGCIKCCMDGITVFEVEARNIREHYGGLLELGVPHTEDACAFLDSDGTCRIYQYRPYVCRTQGLPLRWLDETETGDIVELRDICPENESGPAIVTLPEEQCWTIGPFELRLAALQALVSGKETVRVPLRSLFKPSASTGVKKDIAEPEALSMEIDIDISTCTKTDEQEISELLREAGLLTADLTPKKFRNFLVARIKNRDIIGTAGCEAFGGYGLLRSLAVRPDYQGSGLGRILMAEMEAYARKLGIKTLYLLTTTAPDYFTKLGFQVTKRSSAPGCIAATEEFRGLCPVSAVCMYKQL